MEDHMSTKEKHNRKSEYDYKPLSESKPLLLHFTQTYSISGKRSKGILSCTYEICVRALYSNPGFAVE